VLIDIDNVAWAEYIFLMENSHKIKLQDKFKEVLNHQKVICLGAPDKYPYIDEKLVAILERKVASLVK
jgi:predicted protein tyrosine phosphatase